MFKYHVNYFCSFNSLFLSVNKGFELHILFGILSSCLLGFYCCREHSCRISHRVYPKCKDTLCWPSSKEYNPFGLWCIWCTPTCEQVELGTDHVPLHQWLHCSGNLERPVRHSHWFFFLKKKCTFFDRKYGKRKKVDLKYVNLLMENRLLEQRKVWRSHGQHSQLVLVPHL